MTKIPRSIKWSISNSLDWMSVNDKFWTYLCGNTGNVATLWEFSTDLWGKLVDMGSSVSSSFLKNLLIILWKLWRCNGNFYGWYFKSQLYYHWAGWLPMATTWGDSLHPLLDIKKSEMSNLEWHLKEHSLSVCISYLQKYNNAHRIFEKLTNWSCIFQVTENSGLKKSMLHKFGCCS